jgi:hypothetical protein
MLSPTCNVGRELPAQFARPAVLLVLPRKGTQARETLPGLAGILHFAPFPFRTVVVPPVPWAFAELIHFVQENWQGVGAHSRLVQSQETYSTPGVECRQSIGTPLRDCLWAAAMLFQ